MANATMSKDEILDAIGNMSVFELAELIEAFKTKFNVTISAAPVGAAPAAGGAGAAAAPAAEEQAEFAVNLKAAGAKKIQVIKVVRELTGLGLKEAKDLVDADASSVESGVPEDETAAIGHSLEDQETEVEEVFGPGWAVNRIAHFNFDEMLGSRHRSTTDALPIAPPHHCVNFAAAGAGVV